MYKTDSTVQMDDLIATSEEDEEDYSPNINSLRLNISKNLTKKLE